MPNRSNSIVLAAIAIMALLNAGVFLLGDRPLQMNDTPLQIPMSLSSERQAWQGKPRKLLHYEDVVLAPAKLTTRIYHPTGGQDGASHNRWHWIWLDMLESRSVGSMHNFFDSMIASGGKPRVLGTHTIATPQGLLRTSLVATRSNNGNTFYMLLWYQSAGESASNRWQWYWKILRARMDHRNKAWSLIKIATPVRNPNIPIPDSPELRRLEEFSSAVYQTGATEARRP